LNVLVPENQACEFYYLDGPALTETDPRAPLLVLFHGADLSASKDDGTHNEHMEDVFGNSDLITQAVDCGWFVMMHDGGDNDTVPAGASHKFSTYGNERFQRATEAALDHAMSNYRIDKDRIYAYGFSMGGQEALSFAARHADPFGPMFAATFTHSGFLSSTFQFFSGGSLPFGVVYGPPGSPVCYCSDPFPWQRANILDPDDAFYFGDCGAVMCQAGMAPPPTIAALDQDNSMINNIGGMPVHLAFVETESPLMQLTNQVAFDFLCTKTPAVMPTMTTFADCNAINNKIKTTFEGPGGCMNTGRVEAACSSPGCITTPQGADCPAAGMNPESDHNWRTLCSRLALDFFDGKTLADRFDNVNSMKHTTLIAESDTRYYYFRVERDEDQEFAIIDGWQVNGPQFPNPDNIMRIDGIQNVTTLRIEAQRSRAHGLDALNTRSTTHPLRIQMPVVIEPELTVLEVTGYANAPSGVTRLNPPGAPVPYPSTHANGVVRIEGPLGELANSIFQITP
jgi:pimeloyl-ACP methyl ester carboxylesterase